MASNADKASVTAADLQALFAAVDDDAEFCRFFEVCSSNNVIYNRIFRRQNLVRELAYAKRILAASLER